MPTTALRRWGAPYARVLVHPRVRSAFAWGLMHTAKSVRINDTGTPLHPDAAP